MGLLKKEEKLLKRLFQKRINEVEGYISHNQHRADAIEAKGAVLDTITLTIEKYRRELNELKYLEAKIFRELYKYEADNSRQKIR